MKRLLVLALVCLAVVSCKKDDDDDNVSNHCGSNYTCVPDTAFEQKLIDFGHDNVMDGKVLTANISSVDSLDVSVHPGRGNIVDLTGIEDFSSLTYLDCHNNYLTSLDVSQNTALIELRCYGNELTSLDVSGCTVLNALDFVYNHITSIDVSQNTDLTKLSALGNDLTSLDVSQNTSLNILLCENNQLTCLNVKNGNNTNFIEFRAFDNPDLTCIEVDNPNWATQNWTDIDPGVTFSTNCNYPAGCF